MRMSCLNHIALTPMKSVKIIGPTSTEPVDFKCLFSSPTKVETVLVRQKPKTNHSYEP